MENVAQKIEKSIFENDYHFAPLCFDLLKKRTPPGLISAGFRKAILYMSELFFRQQQLLRPAY